MIEQKSNEEAIGHVRSQGECKRTTHRDQVSIQPDIPGEFGELYPNEKHHSPNDSCGKDGK